MKEIEQDIMTVIGQRRTVNGKCMDAEEDSGDSEDSDY